jgi:hypothetical protein
MIPSAFLDYVEGLEAHDLEKIGGSFADGVVFITSVKTMEREEILEFLGALYRAFPDWSYDHDAPVVGEDGMIEVRWRQGGTHTGRLEFPGFPGVEATGKAVRIPEHAFRYRVDDAGVREIRPDEVPGGAPRGIFEQIGVALPPL